MPSNADVKVKRTGDVIVNGEIAGRVEKQETPWLFGSVRTEWVPFGADGEALSSGYDTRKRAVDRVAVSVAPLQVTDVERREGWMGVYVSARVSVAGTTMFVSRYPTESYWVVDALFTPGSMMPVFSNGDGARATVGRTPNAEMSEAVTAAAIGAGLWPMA